MFKSHKKNSSLKDVDGRVAAIRALSKADESRKKKKKAEDSDSNFGNLINFLSDEAPECRIAAAEELGKTSRDVAFTHISHVLNTEKDETVVKAMKAALVSIRENMRQEHSEKA